MERLGILCLSELAPINCVCDKLKVMRKFRFQKGDIGLVGGEVRQDNHARLKGSSWSERKDVSFT